MFSTPATSALPPPASPPSPPLPPPLPPPTALQTTKVRLIQSKLLLLRARELAPVDCGLHAHYSALLPRLEATRASLSAQSRPPRASLARHLEIHTRASVMVLVQAVRLSGRAPSAERALTAHRVAAFLHAPPTRPAFRVAARACTRQMLAWFDAAVTALFWPEKLYPVPDRLAFVDELLPAIPCPRDAGLCSICCSDLEPDQSVRAFSVCVHLFHVHCLDRWLLGHQETCPLCREALQPLLVLVPHLRKLDAYILHLQAANRHSSGSIPTQYDGHA